MNIPIAIHVVTVVSADAMVIYQQVYVNNEDAARADLKRQELTHSDLLLNGGSMLLKRF